MSFKESIQEVLDKLSASGDVKKLYGEPIEKNGKTVIPVASIAYGVGGGAGKRPNGDGEEGEGGGGGVRAKPLGVIEITERGTRFIRFDKLPVLISIAIIAWAARGIVKVVAKKF